MSSPSASPARDASNAPEVKDEEDASMSMQIDEPAATENQTEASRENGPEMEEIEAMSSDDVEESAPVKKESDLTLGGSIDKKAFALLAGIYEDNKNSTKTTLSVPLTTLPAILGRTQNTNNEHIFDLGNCKQLSRKHAVIFFSDVNNGKIGKFKTDPTSSKEDTDIKIDDEWTYKPPKDNKEKVIHKKGSSLPKEGFYAISCLSKNKIIVDGQRIEQGQTAALRHGSTVKMLTFTLYFLLPDDVPSKPKCFTVPNPQDDENDDTDGGPPHKKIKKEKEEIDQRPLPELMKEFLDAIENDRFERKHSMISTSILQHAVKDATNDKSLLALSKKEGGVSRTVLMDWISDSTVYGEYVAALLTKLEMKSYQQNLSRALIKGRFKRLGTTGRHVKWLWPGQDLSKSSKSKSKDSGEKKESSSKSSDTKSKEDRKTSSPEKASSEKTPKSNDGSDHSEAPSEKKQETESTNSSFEAGAESENVKDAEANEKEVDKDDVQSEEADSEAEANEQEGPSEEKEDSGVGRDSSLDEEDNTVAKGMQSPEREDNMEI